MRTTHGRGKHVRASAEAGAKTQRSTAVTDQDAEKASAKEDDNKNTGGDADQNTDASRDAKAVGCRGGCRSGCGYGGTCEYEAKHGGAARAATKGRRQTAH